MAKKKADDAAKLAQQAEGNESAVQDEAALADEAVKTAAVASMPEETATAGGAGETADLAAVLKRLDSLEKLLEEQTASGRKTLRSRRLSTFFMFALVVVFAGGLIWLNQTLETVTREVPQLIETTTHSVQQLEVTLQDISKIDFAAMNDAISDVGKGVSEINFEALNASIEDLEKTTKALSNVVGIFG